MSSPSVLPSSRITMETYNGHVSTGRTKDWRMGATLKTVYRKKVHPAPSHKILHCFFHKALTQTPDDGRRIKRRPVVPFPCLRKEWEQHLQYCLFLFFTVNRIYYASIEDRPPHSRIVRRLPRAEGHGQSHNIPRIQTKLRRVDLRNVHISATTFGGERALD